MHQDIASVPSTGRLRNEDAVSEKRIKRKKEGAVLLLLLCFFFYCYVAHRDLHSFPSRLSSVYE